RLNKVEKSEEPQLIIVEKPEEPQLNVVEKISQEFTLAKGEKVIAIHPPEATVQIQKDVVAVPYKSVSKNLSESVSLSAINHVVEQNNYTNLYLQTLGKQLNRIEMSNYPCKPDPQPSKEDSPKNTIQPLMIKP
ncbi:hypothetical protein OFM39_25060, partial [Escherichia coli]|nr:hypothetical protein [Escherichia coli]